MSIESSVTTATRIVAILERVKLLEQAIEAKPFRYRDTAGPFTLDIEMGAKFARLVTGTQERHDRSVHAFVDLSNGDLLKADGWKRPAKGPRGNLLDDASFARILDRADRYGGYLYKSKGA